MTMTTNDPWHELARPGAIGQLCTRRVDPDVEWGFYWGRGNGGELLFVVRHDGPEVPHDRIPRLRGITVQEEPEAEGAERFLILRLDEKSNRDIFAELCRDIVRSASEVSSQQEAISHTLLRTWKWHHLLRGGAATRLSAEQQKGLVAELMFLRDQLIPVVGVARAVQAWRGPFGSPKDFVLARQAVEVKSIRTGGPRRIRISSAEQLASDGFDSLFVHVRTVDSATGPGGAATTLEEIVESVLEVVSGNEPHALASVEQALVASGYDSKHDYSNAYWVPGSCEYFNVIGEFPRICPEELCTGVRDVGYSVDLQHCRPFATDIDAVLGALTEEN